jgi:hypothetical protein
MQVLGTPIYHFRQMDNLSEVAKRKARLLEELDAEIASALRSGKRTHHFSLALMVLALACSVVAAVGGIFFKVPADIVGGIAVLSPLIAFVAVNLKLEGKCGWHYRRKDMLWALRSRLLYQLPESPTLENLAAIAADWDKITAEMQAEWEQRLSLNWSGIQGQQK